MRRHRQQAFTLIEILIVVIILGILATIVIGVFANSSADASAKALQDDLRTIRGQLQVYAAQHGTYPTVADFDDQMTHYSDVSGNTATSKDPSYPYGPYIMSIPSMPTGTEKGKNTITTGASYVPGFAWRYDSTNGHFLANLPDSDKDGNGVSMNTY